MSDDRPTSRKRQQAKDLLSRAFPWESNVFDQDDACRVVDLIVDAVIDEVRDSFPAVASTDPRPLRLDEMDLLWALVGMLRRDYDAGSDPQRAATLIAELLNRQRSIE